MLGEEHALFLRHKVACALLRHYTRTVALVRKPISFESPPVLIESWNLSEHCWNIRLKDAKETVVDAEGDHLAVFPISIVGFDEEFQLTVIIVNFVP